MRHRVRLAAERADRSLHPPARSTALEAAQAVVTAGSRPQALQSMWTVLWTTGRSDDTRHGAQRSTWTRLTALLQLPTVLTLEPTLQSEFNF